MKNLLRILPSLVVLVALVGGCNAGRSASEPSFTTHADAYVAGERVVVQLHNETETPFGYNICFAFLSLEREADGVWEQVPVNLGPEPNAACTLELRTLAPGERAESDVHLPSDLAAGTYRLATDVEVGDTPQVVETDPFEVRE